MSPARALALLALVLSGAIAPRLAFADAASQARAARSFKEARAAYARGDYTTAALAFEQASEYESHPAPLLNAAAAWELAGDPARAIADCERVLAMSNVPADVRTRADEKRKALLPKVGTVRFEGAANYRVREGDRPPLPVPATWRLAPGKHAFDVLDENGSVVRSLEVTITAGQNLVSRVDPPPPAAAKPIAPVPTPAEDKRPAVPLGTWIALGVAGAAGATTAVFGFLTIDAQGRYEDGPTIERRDSFDTNKTITNVAAITTGVALATGAVIYFVFRPKSDAFAPHARGLQFTF